MSGFNGSGSFNFTYNWVNDANNNIPITASRMDTQFNDAANGFDLCLTRDGQGSASANLPMNTFKLTGLGPGTASTDSATFGQLTVATGALTGFIGGLTLSTAGGSGTFGIASGAASDSTSARLLSLASAFTKTTASFVAGTGTGALDAGSIAISTWYHVYIIGSPALTSDILFSTSPTGPTLPSGYTLFRYIGSMLTDGSSHWVRFIQTGNEFLWFQPLRDQSVTPTSGGSLYIVNVPSGVSVTAMIGGVVANGVPGQTAYFNSPFQATQANNSQISVSAQGNEVGFTLPPIRTNTAQQIFAQSNITGGQIDFGVQGWIDLRGSL